MKNIFLSLLFFLCVTPICARSHHHPTPTPTPTVRVTPTRTPTPTPTLTITPTPTGVPSGSLRVNPMCISSHLSWLSSNDVDKQLALMKAAGIYWIRVDFQWDQMETSQNVWNFSIFDNIVTKANAQGMQILALLPQYEVPNWRKVSAGSGNWAYPAKSATEYAGFVSKVVQHFSGKIALYELGNEPDISVFWKPAPDVVAYSAFLKAGYTAVKTNDSNAKVISAGLTAYDQKSFINAMYANGVKGSFDYFGYHPYTWPASPDGSFGFTQMNTIRSIMSTNGDLKPIMATEVGWPTYSGGVTEPVQATYIDRVFKKIIVEDYQFVTLACIYDFKNDGTSTSDPESNFGIIRYDYSLKPAYSTMLNERNFFNTNFSQINP